MSALEWKLAQNACLAQSPDADVPHLMNPFGDDNEAARRIGAAADVVARREELVRVSGFGRWPDPRHDMPGFITSFTKYVRVAYRLCRQDPDGITDGTVDDVFNVVELGTDGPAYLGGFDDGESDNREWLFAGRSYLCLLVAVALQSSAGRQRAFNECVQEMDADEARGDASDPDVDGLADLLALVAPRRLSAQMYGVTDLPGSPSKDDATDLWGSAWKAMAPSRLFVNRISRRDALPRWMPRWPFPRRR